MILTAVNKAARSIESKLGAPKPGTQQANLVPSRPFGCFGASERLPNFAAWIGLHLLASLLRVFWGPFDVFQENLGKHKP